LDKKEGFPRIKEVCKTISFTISMSVTINHCILPEENKYMGPACIYIYVENRVF